jgi:amino acid permease
LALPKIANDALRVSYAFPVLALIYILILMIAEAPDYINTIHEPVEMFTGSWLDYLQNIGIFIYGYNCITSFHYVYTQVSRQSKVRLDKITNRTMALLWLIYLPIGIVAYWSFGDQLKIKGAELFPNRPGIPGKTDYMMAIGRVAMIPTCWIVLLINSFPFKDQVFSLFRITRTYWSNIWVTFVSLFVASAIGWAYPSVTDWFSLLGAFCGAFLNSYFPGMVYIKTFKKAPKRKWLIPFTWIWMITMMVIL